MSDDIEFQRYLKKKGVRAKARIKQKVKDRCTGNNKQRACRKQDRVASFWGLDGEGVGDGPHRYIMMCAASEKGREYAKYKYNPNGMSTIECLDFILSIPASVKIFMYCFSYDLTKIFQDMPDELIYRLTHPELRKGDHGVPVPIRWKGYRINLMSSKLVVAREGRGSQSRTVWDVFKFFGTKFTSALVSWGIATEAELKHMSEMKEARSEFNKLPVHEISAYCIDECVRLGMLVRRLVQGHEACGLELKNFFGAGSSGEAMLTKLGIKAVIRPPPEELEEILARAFTAGRFENSILGRCEQPVYNWDINSAYPYHISFLPCLIHSAWRYTTCEEDLKHVRHALVRYVLPPPSKRESWGPFPYRVGPGAVIADGHKTASGSIIYPDASPGGWIYLQEYQAGKRAFPRVQFVEAWLLEENCDCAPFKAFPQYYLERCRIGKDGPGLALKLGMNSGYGKLAQSVGTPVFQCWTWAGMITGGCRAQALDLIAAHRNRKHVLMIATDGLFTTEEVIPPEPIPTGTEMLGPKRLGAWDGGRSADGTPTIPSGVFAARPGVYFPLQPSEKLMKQVRGRGLGKYAVYRNATKIMKAYEEGGPSGTVIIDDLGPEAAGISRKIRRFAGMVSSIHPKLVDGAVVYTRSAHYGEWVPHSVQMSFDPLPKRAGLDDDGRSLLLRRVEGSSISAPYAKAAREHVPEGLLQMMLEEQPDGDISA